MEARWGQHKSLDSASQEKMQISQRYQMIHYQREGELMSVSPNITETDGEIPQIQTSERLSSFWVLLHTLHTHTYRFLICANKSRRWKKLTILSFFTWRWQQCAQGHLRHPLCTKRHLRFNLGKAACFSCHVYIVCVIECEIIILFKNKSTVKWSKKWTAS